MSRQLRIAHLTPYYAPVIGGVEVVCQYLSEELANRGHEVHVFTGNRHHKGSLHRSMPRHEVIRGVHVHRFRSYVNVGHYGLWPGVIKPLAAGRFDIVHCHGYRQPQSEIGSRVGSRHGAATILHVHGGFFARSRLKRRAYDAFDWVARRGAANRFDHFIALSELDRERLVSLNVAPQRVSIVRNAAEPDAFDDIDASAFRARHGLEGKRVILYLGILHHFKRPELLIRALPRIVEEVPNAFVLFVGPDAGELGKVRSLAEELGVTSSYAWLGPLRGAEKHAAIEAADFVALPSDEDPFPLVLLEAMAHGKPVVTTEVVGQARIIGEHDAGIIIKPGDLDAIVGACSTLLSQRPCRDEIAGNARRLAETMFSPQASVDEIEALYEEVLARRDAGRDYAGGSPQVVPPSMR